MDVSQLPGNSPSPFKHPPPLHSCSQQQPKKKVDGVGAGLQWSGRKDHVPSPTSLHPKAGISGSPPTSSSLGWEIALESSFSIVPREQSL